LERGRRSSFKAKVKFAAKKRKRHKESRSLCLLCFLRAISIGMLSTISQAETDNQAGRSEDDRRNGFAQNTERGDLGAFSRVTDKAEERTHKHSKEELFHDRPCPIGSCPCIFPFFQGRGRTLIQQ